jgi:hypothetical protein
MLGVWAVARKGSFRNSGMKTTPHMFFLQPHGINAQWVNLLNV